MSRLPAALAMALAAGIDPSFVSDFARAMRAAEAKSATEAGNMRVKRAAWKRERQARQRRAQIGGAS